MLSARGWPQTALLATLGTTATCSNVRPYLFARARAAACGRAISAIFDPSRGTNIRAFIFVLQLPAVANMVAPVTQVAAATAGRLFRGQRDRWLSSSHERC